jgi:Skp family chaperone for outer membrane proteins
MPVHFNNEINLGAVINCVVIGAGLVGWLVTSSNNATQASRELTVLKSDVAGQLKDLRADISNNVSDLRAELKNLPDQRADIETLKRWVTQLDTRVNALETRIGTVERNLPK